MTREQTQLRPLLERLAAYVPSGLPFVSVYLDLQPDQHGQDRFEPFVRKHLTAGAITRPVHSTERRSLDRDLERIGRYLHYELRPSANGAAIFACSAADDFFHSLQLDVPIEKNELHVQPQPHVYPLVRLIDQYPRHAVLVTDTNAARLFVIELGGILSRQHLTSEKMARTSAGGWSQARYQRHVDDHYLHHAKEVANELDQVVRRESPRKIVIAAEEVIKPMLRDELPRHLVDRVVEVHGVDMATPDTLVLRAALDALRVEDAKDDAARVERLFNQFRAGGLAVIGVRDTLSALDKGQVDELLMSASFTDLHLDDDFDRLSGGFVNAASAGVARAAQRAQAKTDQPVLARSQAVEQEDRDRLHAQATAANELALRALRTGALITFIENGELLTDAGGVGALLRYKG